MTLLGRRYRIGELVGRGGSADVHVAVDELLDRRVVVKVLREPASADLWAAVRAAAGLRHPHVVETLDAGTDPTGRPYVVLDLVDGPTLAQLVDEGPLPFGDVLAIGTGVLEGLAHAHAHGVLHLDLSAGNVMLRRADDGTPDPGAAVVLDLGAERRPIVGGGLVAVTPHYASPEIATGQAGDERSDVYSAGALLYELATGQLPFGSVGEDAGSVLRAQVHRVAPPPSFLDGDLPRAFDRLVARALAKDPRDRHPDVTALLDEVVQLARAVDLPAGGPRRTRDGGRAVVVRTTRPLEPVAVTPVRAMVESAGVRGARAATTQAAPESAPTPRSGSGPRWLAAFAAVLVVAVVVGLVHSGLGAAGAAQPEVPPVRASTPTTATVTGTPTAHATRHATAPPPPTTPTLVALPSLAGLSLDDARAAVAAAGLRLGGVQEADGPTPPGVVLAMTPAPGDVGPDAVVDLVVASGYTVVPEVGGTTAADASAALRRLGLVVTELPTPGGVAGTALRTAPNAGRRVPVGYTVILLVGAPPVVEPTASPSATPVLSPTPGPTQADP
ncbi:PASTA domain-containing protein [Cellulomonas sp. URHD0024]|uniref:protein kinase domain-containing protein n=1 Tax=Cellulomonas sp. URHD0024 TaxID=1302620 RepID=UPI0003F864E6|nr:PASTA domain-containing protein [Cellulomonas sp. URHD0024]